MARAAPRLLAFRLRLRARLRFHGLDDSGFWMPRCGRIANVAASDGATVVMWLIAHIPPALLDSSKRERT